MTENSLSPKPLTIEEIKKKNRKPIWVVPLKDMGEYCSLNKPQYVLINLETYKEGLIYLVLSNGGTVTWLLSEYGKNWIAFEAEPSEKIEN